MVGGAQVRRVRSGPGMGVVSRVPVGPEWVRMPGGVAGRRQARSKVGFSRQGSSKRIRECKVREGGREERKRMMARGWRVASCKKSTSD